MRTANLHLYHVAQDITFILHFGQLIEMAGDLTLTLTFDILLLLSDSLS